MKQLLLLLPLTLLSVPVQAQQVNQFAVCTQNQEVYRPGGYDRYGNYVPGGVSVQTYNVPCNNINQGWRPTNQYYGNGYGYGGRYCNPTRSALGALLGGGIAASMSRGNGYYWSVPVGAAIGGAMFGCN
jgi:hypothetical protein